MLDKIKNINFFSCKFCCKFFPVFGHQTLDPYPGPAIGIQPKMLDTDPDSMNPDPKHCFFGWENSDN
jgi:hypothetical protein